MIYIRLFLTFFKCGLLALGGGSAAVALIENEAVDELKLMTQEGFSDLYILGQSLPGPIATKLSAVIGYQLSGIPGAFVAVVSIVLPSSILIIIYKFLLTTDIKWMDKINKTLQPVVMVLILQLFIKTFCIHLSLVQLSERLMSVLLIVLAFIGIILMKLNITTIMIATIIFGLLR